MNEVHNMTVFFFCGTMVENKVVFIQVFAAAVHFQKQILHPVIGVGAPQNIYTKCKRCTRGKYPEKGLGSLAVILNFV